MDTKNIIFDLWPDGAFTQKDVVELEDIISNIDSTSGQIGSDIRGLDIQTTIEFAVLAVATGFFNKLGEDAYDYLKQRFAKLLIKPIEKSKREGTYELGDGGIIWLFTHEQKINIKMIAIYENEDGIYKFIDKIDKGLNWLNSAIINKEIDSNHEGEIEFKFVDRKEDNPTGWHYTNNKLIFEVKIKKEKRLIKVKEGEI